MTTRTEGYRNRPVTQATTARAARSEILVGGPGVAVARVLAPCGGCGIPTKIRVGGKPGHYKCLTSNNTVQEPGPEEMSAFRLLKESILASRKHPILRIPADQRGDAPWTLITEMMRGEHRYRVDAPDGRVVMTLDRNGSYPSAMGNVPVAANKLLHTGPLTEYSTTAAGIFQIERFGWADGPHPLGEIADNRDKAWWVSTPHLRLALRLVEDGRIPPVRILDSWTGVSASNLFKQYAVDVQNIRARAAADPEAYGDAKRQTSIAIRCLWPKGARSPFWRPDWSVSVRAEAAVRHWVRADQAQRAGGQLLKLGSVDEVAFALEEGADQPPVPYREGPGYGLVKIKTIVPAQAWNARGTR